MREVDALIPTSSATSPRAVRFTGVVHHGLSLGIFEAGLVLSGLCLGVAAFVQPRSHQLPLLFVAALTALWTTMKSVRRVPPKRGEFVVEDGVLRTDAGAFVMGIPRGVFACLSDRHAPHATLVLVENRKALLEIVLRTETEARDLAKRLGLWDGAIITGDEKPAAAKFAVTVVVSLLLALIVFPALASGAPGLTMLAITVGVLLTVCLAASQYTSARVGADGVFVRGSIENRFVSFAEIRGVSEFGPWVRLHTGARDVFISTPCLPWSLHRDAARKSLVEQIATRLSRYREAEAPASERAIVGEGTFRSPETTLHDLASIAESPRARPELRVEAARAIRSHAQWQELAPRLRVAANASASPELSKALALAAREEREGEVLEREFDPLPTTTSGR